MFINRHRLTRTGFVILALICSFVSFVSCRKSHSNGQRERSSHISEQRDGREVAPPSGQGVSGEWSSSDLEKANTVSGVDYLSTEEQQVIVLCNLARLDGEKFVRTYAKPYLKDQSNDYIISLYSDLKKVKKRKMLVPDERLSAAAKFHAQDMGGAGLIGHNSSDGTPMDKRLSKWYPHYMLLGENCDYGYDKALDIVMHLLVDEGVESLGHRKNILNAQFGKIGVSIQPHKTYRYNCVQDFAN